jgi:hypothetical protein
MNDSCRGGCDRGCTEKRLLASRGTDRKIRLRHFHGRDGEGRRPDGGDRELDGLVDEGGASLRRDRRRSGEGEVQRGVVVGEGTKLRRGSGIHHQIHVLTHVERRRARPRDSLGRERGSLEGQRRKEGLGLLLVLLQLVEPLHLEVLRLELVEVLLHPLSIVGGAFAGG